MSYTVCDFILILILDQKKCPREAEDPGEGGVLPPVQPLAGHRHRPQGGPPQPRHRGRGARRAEDHAMAQGEIVRSGY